MDGVIEPIYRIREYCGTYTIQRLYYKESGILCWKKQEEFWRNVDIMGNYQHLFIYPTATYETLKKAKKEIRLFKKGVTYHRGLL